MKFGPIFPCGLAALLVLAAGAARAETLPKPVAGPARLCFKYSSFELAEGERLTTVIGGAEGMRVLIDGPDGQLTLDESEIFGRSTAPDRLVEVRGGTRVYRPGGGSSGYAVAGRPAFSPGRYVILVRLEGPMLARRGPAKAVYRRVRIGRSAKLKCDWTYTYGLF
jgi:hypothetical protein